MWHALNLAGHLTSLSGPARARNPLLPVGVTPLARNHCGGLDVLSRMRLRSSDVVEIISITVIFPCIAVLCDAPTRIVLG
jgi:hypothetical protein